MSFSVAGPDAVACLERILEAQVRLVELQEAQVRLLERCAPAPPPPPGEQAARAAAGPPAPPSALTHGLPAAEPPPVAGPREAPPPPVRVLGEAAAHGMRAPADGERPPPAGLTAEEEGSKATSGEQSEATTALRRELGEELLVCGAWVPEICHKNLVQRISRRPDRIPIALERLLVVLGVLSPLEISAGWRRSVYRAHRALIPLTLIFSLAIEAIRMYVVHVVIGMDTDVSEIMTYVFTIYGRLFILLPSIFVWRHQFSPRGAILDLMCSMDERQIPWHQFTNGVRIAWCVSACGVALVYFSVLWPKAEPFLDAGLALDSASSVALCLSLVDFVMHMKVIFIYMGSHYLVFFASRLHRHDLLCYAGAMVKAMEGDGVASDVVPSLKRLELLMTARLRHASRTWVRFTMYEIIYMGAWALISAMFLMSGTDSSKWLGKLVWLSGLIVALLAPMASVAETFDYDVLKALNNPSILKGAQKYVGQQLLAHLSSLDWGFRIGGLVISTDLVSKIATTLCIGVLTTVSSAIQSQLGDAVF